MPADKCSLSLYLSILNEIGFLIKFKSDHISWWFKQHDGMKALNIPNVQQDLPEI